MDPKYVNNDVFTNPLFTNDKVQFDATFLRQLGDEEVASQWQPRKLLIAENRNCFDNNHCDLCVPKKTLHRNTITNI